MQRGRCRFDPDRLHFASVVSTASTRPLYGRGAGSTPAGGSFPTSAHRSGRCRATAGPPVRLRPGVIADVAQLEEHRGATLGRPVRSGSSAPLGRDVPRLSPASSSDRRAPRAPLRQRGARDASPASRPGRRVSRQGSTPGQGRRARRAPHGTARVGAIRAAARAARRVGRRAAGSTSPGLRLIVRMWRNRKTHRPQKPAARTAMGVRLPPSAPCLRSSAEEQRASTPRRRGSNPLGGSLMAAATGPAAHRPPTRGRTGRRSVRAASRAQRRRPR